MANKHIGSSFESFLEEEGLPTVPRGKACPRCKLASYYNDEYDAYACIACELWLEAPCDDPTCDYCAARPKKPPRTLIGAW